MNNNDNRVRALSRIENNSFCADCGISNKKSAIKFCSVKLGVYLCNQCYAAHRSLGAHITRVKCIGLDDFTDAEVEFLQRFGNLRVNAIYEATLPITGVKPPPTSCRGCTSSSCNDCRERLQYIQQKYEKKCWYKEEETGTIMEESSFPVQPQQLQAPAPKTGAIQQNHQTRYQTQTTPGRKPIDDDFFASFGL